MKLTEDKKTHIARKAFDGIARGPHRLLEFRKAKLHHEIQREFSQFIQTKVDAIKIDSFLNDHGFISKYKRTVTYSKVQNINIRSSVPIHGAYCSIKDNSPEFDNEVFDSVPTIMGNMSMSMSNIPEEYISQELQEQVDQLITDAHEYNEHIDKVVKSIEMPLRTSSTLKQLLEVWPSAAMLIPQQWHDEEAQRKENERIRREEAKRARILAEQKQALNIEEQRKMLSDIDNQLLTAKMLGDVE
jgi:hypothetical protein